MYLLGTRFPDKINYSLRSGSTDNTVVNENDSLATDSFPYNIELYLYGVGSLCLRWLNERPSHISVLDKAYAVRNARCSGKAQRRIKSAVGNADNNISVNRVLLPEVLACFKACMMNA